MKFSGPEASGLAVYYDNNNNGKIFYDIWITETCDEMYIGGSNTFHNFTVDTPPKIISFGEDTTQTITGDFICNGEDGKLMILQL